MAERTIYLDNAGTTKAYDEVVSEMNKFHLKEFGNPSSLHDFGERALEAVNNSRILLAREIGCKAKEIIFTSGTTESNSLAFLGLARSELGEKKKKIIISSVEHPSVFAVCDALKRDGFQIVELKVNNSGVLPKEEIEKEIDDNTLLVSVVHVNNEAGVIQDIRKIGNLCRKRSVLFHTDCAQSFGKLRINVRDFNVDLLSAGAHKLGGPKGTGLLFARRGIILEPLIYGSQERRIRGGTENVPGIAGFVKALEISRKINREKTRKIRDYFISRLEKMGGKINGSKEHRIYNNVSVSFPGLDGEDLVLKLSQKGIMCSTGSACESRKENESRTLKALGLSEEEIKGSLRFTLNEEITRSDIEFVLRCLEKTLGG